MATLVGTSEPLSRTVPRPVAPGVIFALESSQGRAVREEINLKWCRSPWTTGVDPVGLGECSVCHPTNHPLPLQRVDLILTRCVSEGLLLKARQHLSLTDVSGCENPLNPRADRTPCRLHLPRHVALMLTNGNM